MRMTATKTVSLVGIVAVAALCTQYASAATTAGARHDAQQGVAPLRNIAYQYSTATSGGTGDETFTIPNPPNGLYYASFTANFYPEGSPGAPETFGCSLIKDGTIMRAQDTASTTYDEGFYAGVNGGNVIKIDHVAQFQVFCGTDDGTSWTWGTRPVQVNLVRVDGLVQGGNMTQPAPKQRGQLQVDASAR
jgi:hypothetical protein